RRAVFSCDETDLVCGDDCRGVDFDVEEVGVNSISPGQDDLDLRPQLPARAEEGLAVLERLMPLHLSGRQAPGRNRIAMACAGDADLALANRDYGLSANREEVGIDSVLAGGKDVDLRALLAAVSEERFAVLEGIVPLHVPGEDPTRLERQTVDRLEDTDFVFADHEHVCL